jgi:hypothetical protein
LIGGGGTNLRGAGGLSANARSTMRNDRGQKAARAAGDGEQDVPPVQTIRCSPAATETIALGRKNELQNQNTCGARHHDSYTP